MGDSDSTEPFTTEELNLKNMPGAIAAVKNQETYAHRRERDLIVEKGNLEARLSQIAAALPKVKKEKEEIKSRKRELESAIEGRLDAVKQEIRDYIKIEADCLENDDFPGMEAADKKVKKHKADLKKLLASKADLAG